MYTGSMMPLDRLLSSAQSVLNVCELKEDEETLGPQFWNAQCTRCEEACIDIQSLLGSSTESPLVPPVQLLILIGGILGNRSTSEKLHTRDQLGPSCESLLAMLLRSCHCQTARDLLLTQPHPSSQPRSDTLARQFLRLCVAQIARAPSHDHEEALNFRPFYRDALLWLSEQLDYPEMTEDEFLGVLQPFGLRLCSDYRPSLQLAGLILLRGLTKKARVADWRQSNRAEAVLNQLFEHRIGSHPGSSELVLQAVYSTILALTRLLESAKATDWWTKIADRLLSDIVMEGKKARLTVLLRQLSTVINVMKTNFVGHSRRFLHALSVVLLGPQTPDYLKKTLTSDAQDDTVYVLILQCTRQFIQFGWPVLSSCAILSDLVASLVAFVDLVVRSPVTEPAAVFPWAPDLREILAALIELEPRILTDILLPACFMVPALSEFIPKTCT